MNFSKDKAEGALFALSRLIRKGNLSRLTTTIRQEKFEGCSVDIATIVSSDGTVMPTCYVVWPNTLSEEQVGSFLQSQRKEGGKRLGK
jgi:hypothetical protein